MSKEYAVITGASSGIGMEMARILYAKGYALILAARRKERLDKLKDELGDDIDVISVDLSNRENCIRFFDEIKDKNITVFINNAGFGDCGYFLETSLDKELNMIDVNIVALHVLTKLVVKLFTEKNIKGRILNVASSAGLLPSGPFMSTYYASKAYVASLSQGLAEELREENTGIYIGALCPGPVDTEFNEVASADFPLKGISARYCAEYAIKSMFKGKVIIVPTWYMKLSTWGVRFLPRKAAARITASQQKKKTGK